jgi:hypothetical protein
VELDPLVTDVNHVDPARVLRDGIAAGLLGALVVAATHLVADAVAGEPLRTPTVLGVLLTDGASAAAETTASTSIALRFTGFHIAAWLALGCIGSWLISLVDAHPRLASVVFSGFAVVYASVLYVSGGFSVLGLPPVHLWLGTLLGPIAAAGYLAWRHPFLARHIEREHLTETEREMLERALEHEAADLASYRVVSREFPAPVFASILEEKRTRAQELREQCEALGLPPSSDPETAHPWKATSFHEALREALDFERQTLAFYDRCLAVGPEVRIRTLFLHLRDHTFDTTLPELERALAADSR